MEKNIKQTIARFGIIDIDELTCEQLAILFDTIEKTSPYGDMSTIYRESNDAERKELQDVLLHHFKDNTSVDIYHVQCEGVDDDTDVFEWMSRHSCWYKKS